MKNNMVIKKTNVTVYTFANEYARYDNKHVCTIDVYATKDCAKYYDAFLSLQNLLKKNGLIAKQWDAAQLMENSKRTAIIVVKEHDFYSTSFNVWMKAVREATEDFKSEWAAK